MTVARDRLEKDGSDGSGLQAPATWGQKGLRKAVKGRRNALQAKDNQPNITPVYPSLSRAARQAHEFVQVLHASRRRDS